MCIRDRSYEYADHERFIDRGIPTENGAPVEALKDVVFGTKDLNLQTLEASILKGILSHNYSETGKLNISVTANDFSKLYKNLYASGYDGTLVTMDGYLDPTSRESLIFSGNIVNEFSNGSTTGTVLFGYDYLDTDNKNYRYNTFFSNTEDDNEIFKVSRPMDFSVNSDGIASTVDYTTDLKSKSESDIEVNSLYLQGLSLIHI